MDSGSGTQNDVMMRCFDRCGLTALSRHIHQCHALVKEQWGGGDKPSWELLWLLEWPVITACSAHDAHNSFRWGLRSSFDNKDLLKDIYCLAESFRKGFCSQWLQVGFIGCVWRLYCVWVHLVVIMFSTLCVRLICVGIES